MKIDKKFISQAAKHIVKKGDTDIFPHPLELKFYAENITEVCEKLSSRDYSAYDPLSLVESLIPKSKHGFRVAHQAYPSDDLLP